MLYIDFCKAPKGFWVGCVEYNNGRAFASGRTMEFLVKNMKTMAYHTWRMSAYNIMLSSRQMERGEFESKHARFMSAKFRGKFWNEKIEKQKEEPKTTIKKRNLKRIKVVVDGVLYNSISEAESKTGMKPDTLGQALRHGQRVTLGHTIAYANDLAEPVKVETTKIENAIQLNTEEAKYSYEEKEGTLYVYEKKLVAQYKIENK